MSHSIVSPVESVAFHRLVSRAPRHLGASLLGRAGLEPLSGQRAGLGTYGAGEMFAVPFWPERGMERRLEEPESAAKGVRKGWVGLALGALGYGLVGWVLMAGTGLTVLEWQFWAMFGPIFVGGEMAVREISRAGD